MILLCIPQIKLFSIHIAAEELKLLLGVGGNITDEVRDLPTEIENWIGTD